MEKQKVNMFDLGKGWIVVILGFLSIFAYSSLMNDSLNIMIGVFEETAGLNSTVLYSFATIGTVVGVIASVIWGKVMQEKTAKFLWVLCLFLVAVFAIVWSRATNYALYLVGYLVCYAGCMGCGTIASGAIISHWFPRKRGLAMGWITAGFPLSAAITSSLCNGLVQKFGHASFYYFIAVVDVVLAIIILAVVKDYPEEMGAYPDNDRNFDKEKAKREFEEGMAYAKTSKWTIKKLMMTPRIYHLTISVGILGFLSMGIMTNFVKKFMGQGYQMPEILMMLAIAGLCAIPGSIFIGWLDVKIGTKKSCIITYVLGIIAIAFNLTDIHVLHYLSLPFLSLMLGGASNFQVSCINAIWGRYDFQNAFRVVQPLGSILSGVGITVVGVVGTTAGYYMAYVVVGIFAIVGLLLYVVLPLKPIDDDVRF